MTDSATREPTFYELLGIRPGASQEEIRSAYRQAMMRVHPDRNKSPNAHQDSIAVNVAYDILKDPSKRAAYDLRMRRGRRAEEQARKAADPGTSTNAGPSKEPGTDKERGPKNERASRNKQHARWRNSWQEDPEPEPERESEPETVFSGTIRWKETGNHDGWAAQLGRATAWVGYTKTGAVSCRIRTKTNWLHDEASAEDAEALENAARRRLRRCNSTVEAIGVVSEAIETASEFGNRAAGTPCQSCRLNYLDGTQNACNSCQREHKTRGYRREYRHRRTEQEYADEERE